MLSQIRLVQFTVKALQIPRMANGILGLLNWTRPLDGGRLRYRIRYFDSVVLAREMFSGSEYGAIEEDIRNIRSFVDLGCNVGYFPLFLCQLRGDKEIRGLCVDANPQMIAEARRNAAINGLDDVMFRHGLIASGDAGTEAEFWITQNSMSSTTDAGSLGSRFGARKTLVPVLDPLAAFRERFRNDRIDLLKIDVEGMELELMTCNPGLVDAADRIILEFHKPRVTLDAATTHLAKRGFRRKFANDKPNLPWGIAYFVR